MLPRPGQDVAPSLLSVGSPQPSDPSPGGVHPRDWMKGSVPSGGLGSARLMVGLNDLKGLFQPK